MPEIERVLQLQDGVIARHQAIEAGLTEVEVARLLRRRAWVAVHRGVYVNHTGSLTWRQSAWAAVLACWPAALDGWSAIRAHEGPGRQRPGNSDVIEVMVAHGRHPTPRAGVRVRQSRRFDDQVLWNLSPPRMHYDDTVLDLADRARRELDAIAVLADACGGRRTTAARLRSRMDLIPRLHRRRWLEQVLEDVAQGTCSVLEHRYLTHVERAHGLPRGDRQDPAPAAARRGLRDVVYRGPGWTQVVELDGRLNHDSTAARDRDLERDLDAALEREHSIRVGHGQVFERACWTGLKLVELLMMRGWRGRFQLCADCPPGLRARVEGVA
ncbi:hypothetical protein [Nocardioides humilatus]|uniref:hypothetical protein n=1 Tax=Nocardioides humilatus TaxID=2607660 RepID=UPI00165EDADC|nr:hypothetical protein [Nocardioides humilatus]